MKKLKSVNVKLTKQIQIHKRRGSAHPVFLNKIKDLMARETVVSDYLQQELYQKVLSTERGNELKREITYLKDKKDIYLKRLHEFSSDTSM